MTNNEDLYAEFNEDLYRIEGILDAQTVGAYLDETVTISVRDAFILAQVLKANRMFDVAGPETFVRLVEG